MPDCRRELVIDASETDDPSVVGEAAHIVAEESNGPRGDSPLTKEQRNLYANLIVLCNVHHKQVDDQVMSFTVDRLIEMKATHERWVGTQLADFDPVRQADDELWAGYVDEWGTRIRLNDWTAWTSNLFSPTPALSFVYLGELDDLNRWLFSRVWPASHPEVRCSLENFRWVLNDLLVTFREHSEDEPSGGGLLRTEKFYKIDRWDQELYGRLAKRFDFHVDLLHDLTFELSRAANYVCDHVRMHLDRSYRLEEGVLIVERQAGLSWDSYRNEYQDDERSVQPYPGLESFFEVRGTRDVAIGKGRPPED